MRRKFLNGTIKNIDLNTSDAAKGHAITADFYKDDKMNTRLIVFPEQREIYAILKSIIFFNVHKETELKVFKIEVEPYLGSNKPYYRVRRLHIELE